MLGVIGHRGRIRKTDTLQGVLRDFDYYAKPFGFPNSSTICGGSRCCRDGYIWLTQQEYDDIQAILREDSKAIIIVELSVANTKIRIDPLSIQSASGRALFSRCQTSPDPSNSSQGRIGAIISYS
jgi:hypothetical protein